MRSSVADDSPDVEQFSGPDALLLHMEDTVTPMHTMKVVILDPTRRGEQVSLEELHDAVHARLGHVRRSTQVPAVLLAFKYTPFWIDDMHFDLWNHLDEVHLAAPCGRVELDGLLSKLAERRLPRDRPLWAMTLVHGLADGRQAVVVRVHHAIADGVASVNLLSAMTTTEPGGAVPVRRPAPARPVAIWTLRSHALRSFWSLLWAFPKFLQLLRETTRIAREEGKHPALPPSMVPRNLLNPRTSNAGRRVAASCTIDMGDVKRIARASGTTVNAVVHTMVATAVRGEFHDRGVPLDEPVSASFGVAQDLAAGARYAGNQVATATVFLHAEDPDPLSRLRRTAASCTAAVERRRLLGFEVTYRATAYGSWIAARLSTFARPWMRFTPTHLSTANVPGPREQRYAGDILVEDWISFAIVTSPADVNITMHSYAGKLSVGLLCTPEAVPEPYRFLARFRPALEELSAALDPDQVAVAG